MTSYSLRSFLAVSLTGALASVLLAASSAKAQSGSENVSFFGTFGQGNNAIVSANSQAVANMACVPTATVNGLTYLQNYQASIGNPNTLTFGPTYTSINNLITSMGTTANGTGMGSAATGLASYLSPIGANPAPSVSISGQYIGLSTFTTGWYTGMPGTFANVTPSATFLANALNANDGVEFTVVWGYMTNGTYFVNGGGHELTLQSINLAANSISFFDPWGNTQPVNNAGTSANLYTANLSVQSGFLTVMYPTNNAITGIEPDPEEIDSTDPGDANGQIGYIVADMVEAVPEPAPLPLACAAMVTWVGWTIYRRRLIKIGS
jgi:hypothetical protein